MKLLFFSILILTNIFCFSQHKMSGNYHNAFGNQIELLNDSTFRYTWRFDLMSSWTNGKWTVSNDTILFTPIYVFDTVSINNKDSLVLSIDKTPNRIDYQTFTFSLLPSGGQNKHPMPRKLYYKKGKLFKISEKGKLDKLKRHGGMTNKKYNTWYTERK